MTAADPVSALPDVQLAAWFRESMRALLSGYNFNKQRDDLANYIDVATRSTTGRATIVPTGDAMLSHWGGDASGPTRRLLSFLKHQFAVDEDHQFSQRGKMVMDREGFVRIFRSTIKKYTKCRDTAVTRALARFEKLGIITRKYDRQENGHRHLWLRFNPLAVFKLLAKLPKFQAFRKEPKVLLVKVWKKADEAAETPTNQEAGNSDNNQSPRPFSSSEPMSDLGAVPCNKGGGSGGVASGGVGVASQVSVTPAPGCPCPTVETKSNPDGCAAADLFSAKTGEPAPKPSAPARCFAGGYAAEVAIAAAMDREVPSSHSKPGIAYAQGMEVVGNDDLTDGAEVGTVKFALPDICVPIFSRLRALHNFVDQPDAPVTDQDLRKFVKWCRHPSPEKRMTVKDVTTYVELREEWTRFDDTLPRWIFTCSFPVFTRAWPAILTALRRTAAAAALEKSLPVLRVMNDFNKAADASISKAASMFAMSGFRCRQWPEQFILDPAEQVRLFTEHARHPEWVAEMDADLALRATSPADLKAARDDRWQFMLARMIISTRRGEQWAELRTPAAIAIQLSMVEHAPVIARGLSVLRCDEIYPLVKHTAPGLQSRLAAQWSKFLGRIEAVVADALHHGLPVWSSVTPPAK